MKLREDMPETAAFIDAMCEALTVYDDKGNMIEDGHEHMRLQISKSMHGLPTFYAEENGHTFGTKAADVGNWVSPTVEPVKVEGKKMVGRHAK